MTYLSSLIFRGYVIYIKKKNKNTALICTKETSEEE